MTHSTGELVLKCRKGSVQLRPITKKNISGFRSMERLVVLRVITKWDASSSQATSPRTPSIPISIKKEESIVIV